MNMRIILSWPYALKTKGRWEDNNKMDLKETGWESVDWIN
jgi:hypothetical protein